MKVNLDGAFYTAQAAAHIFKKQGHGNVIFTASVSATLVNVPQKQAAVRSSSTKRRHHSTNCRSIMPPKPVWSSWPDAYPWNGWISAA